MTESTTFFLGIDAGSSSSKWNLIDEHGKSISSGTSGPTDGHVYRQKSRARLERFLLELVKEIRTDVSGIYAGITGASDIQTENSEIVSLFKGAFPHSEIVVEIDVALGYRAHFAEKKGVYLYAGTGSIAMFQDKDGLIRANGGWGYLLGDEGAGYWFGRELIRTILLEIESHTLDSQLQNILSGEVKEISRNEVIKFAFSRSRDEIAKLAKPVVHLANTGNLRAVEIVKAAARHLAELTLRTEVIAELNGADIVFGGGLAQSGGLLVSELERILERNVITSKDDLSSDAANFARMSFGATN